MKPGDMVYIKDNGYTHTTYENIFVLYDVNGYIPGFKHENGSAVKIIKLTSTEREPTLRHGAFVRNKEGTSFIGLPGLYGEIDTFMEFKKILGDDTDE